jgi:acyl-CoA reductase-like NAD-dependent aldehyde dehydrogenase
MGIDMGVTSKAVSNLSLRISSMREAQSEWAQTPLRRRLEILRRFRKDLAQSATDVASTVPMELAGSLHRSVGDTLCSEVLPLADACRFLEREAISLLSPRKEHSFLRPLWLKGVRVETRREPYGLVLIIGPANYPLFIPGVQTLQALAAGNAVLLKPAPGCRASAEALRRMLVGNGLPGDLLKILDEDPQSVKSAIECGVDKVVLTGSAETGRAVMHGLAETLTPSVMELSGCDAVFVLDGADLTRTVEALTMGMRLNGSATCMAPRRLFATQGVLNRILPLLKQAFAGLKPVPASPEIYETLQYLVTEASLYGAKTILSGLGVEARSKVMLGPTLLSEVDASMCIAKTDIFAPVLCAIRVTGEEDALQKYDQCPYRLAASVFGPRRAAEKLAARINAGTVLVNDVIVSTADPRVSFGGRGSSGFGVTRGANGLLEMTTTKTIVVQRSKSLRTYEATTQAHAELFSAYLRVVHGRGWRMRLNSMREIMIAARKLKLSPQDGSVDEEKR